MGLLLCGFLIFQAVSGMLNNIEIQNKLADIFDVSLDQLHGRSPYQEDETETLMFNHLDGFGDLSQEEQKRIVQQLEEQAEFLIAKAKKNK